MFANLVAVEGPDRVGKQTQTRLLTERLRSEGHKVALVEVPFNDGSTYRLIYWMLKRGYAKTLPNLFQLVQFFNKFFFQATVLVWLWLTHDYVVFDRWSLSAIVYGDATGVNRIFNRVLLFLLKDPNLTIVLHGPRLTDQTEDVYERDTDLQKAVRRGYYDWALAHPWNHELIDNKGTRSEVHERVLDAMERSGVL
jgi:dTMP kinase